jgi:adenine-specific DNA-methyltransferase
VPNDFAGWYEWEVPFDTDPDWPKPLQEALVEYRKAWRAKMDEVNACIAANAEQEELVDQPEIVRGVVRVSGPFTVEGVMPVEESLLEESPIGGAPEELETFPVEATSASLRQTGEPSVCPSGGAAGASASSGEDAASTVEATSASLASWAPHGQSDGDVASTGGRSDVDIASTNAQAYLDQMLRLLRADGVRFPNNKVAKFSRLEPVQGAEFLHAEGEWSAENGKERRVAVSFGPQHGPVTAFQVENALRQAHRRGYDDLVFAGFSFDAAAQAAIQDDPNPKVRCHWPTPGRT